MIKYCNVCCVHSNVIPLELKTRNVISSSGIIEEHDVVIYKEEKEVKLVQCPLCERVMIIEEIE